MYQGFYTLKCECGRSYDINIKESTPQTTSIDNAREAIALAEKYINILPYHKEELEKVTMQRFMLWLREQQ